MWAEFSESLRQTPRIFPFLGDSHDARAARLINDIVIGEETDVDPDGSYVSHLDLYLRAMVDVGANTRQFDTFRSMARVGISVETAMVRTGVPPHVHAFVEHTMALARTGSTEEVLAAFFHGREDIIPEMFSRLQKTLPGAKHDDPLRHFIYYIDRHIELDGDSHGPMGRSCSKVWLPTRQRGTSGLCACVQQYQGPDRALERHFKHNSRHAHEGGNVRCTIRGTTEGRSSEGARTTSGLRTQETDPPPFPAAGRRSWRTEK
jgi:hypothetical protein